MSEPQLGVWGQLELWERDHAPRRRRGDPEPPPPPPPPGRVHLDERHIACASCGREVVAGTHDEFVTDRIVTRWINDRPANIVRLGTCPGCASLDVQARRMLPPGRPETDAMGLARLLIAWRIVGQPLPDPARVTVADVRKWFGNLSLDWAGRILAGSESGRHATVEPFAHVGEDTRAAIRQQFARWQHTRARPGQPLTITPPADGLAGCLMCGVDHLDVPPERAHDAAYIEALWQPVTVDPQALGGRGGQRLRGHLCPACDAACGSLDGPKTVGPSSLERALATWWDATGHQAQARILKTNEVTGIKGWAALSGAEPNPEPWMHINVPTVEQLAGGES